MSNTVAFLTAVYLRCPTHSQHLGAQTSPTCAQGMDNTVSLGSLDCHYSEIAWLENLPLMPVKNFI